MLDTLCSLLRAVALPAAAVECDTALPGRPSRAGSGERALPSAEPALERCILC